MFALFQIRFKSSSTGTYCKDFKNNCTPSKIDIMRILEQYEPLDVKFYLRLYWCEMRNIYDVSSSF